MINKKYISLFIALVFAISLSAQDRIKVMTYNLLNYGNVTSYCTQTNNNMDAKSEYNATIVDYIKPDIIGVVEMGSSNFAHQRYLDSSLNINGVSHFAQAKDLNTTGSSIISLLYYNQDKFGIAGVISLQNTVRDIILYRLYYKSPNLAATQDTAFVNCIVAHLKSSSSSANQAIREQMVQDALGFLKTNYPEDNYLFMGDFNVYKSSEAAYQELINYSDPLYRFNDPINTSGNWNNNSSFAAVHTQSTHSSSNGCAASGGMDDRFDFILISDAIKNGTKHISYVNNSYKAIGNDGNHFNQSINSGTNNSVPANVLNAIYNNSDHLPIVLELDLDNTISSFSDLEKANQIKVYFENPINDNLQITIESKQSQQLNMQLYDVQGRVISDQTIDFTGKTRLDIDMKSFANGIYIIKMINTKGQLVYTNKVIKN